MLVVSLGTLDNAFLVAMERRLAFSLAGVIVSTAYAESIAGWRERR